MSVFNRVLLFAFIFMMFKCQKVSFKQKNAEMLFKLHTAESTGVHFSNLLFETTELNIINFEYLYNGAGVAVGDINGDGLQDLYFSGNMVEGKLYLNKGNFKFEDITTQAGISTKNKWGTGVSMVDINGDGLLDLYLCFSGPYAPERRKNLLYINQGDLTFSEEGASFGLDDAGPTTHAAFFDYDKDGDLDAYLLNNTMGDMGPNIIRPKKIKGEHPNTDQFYRNDGGHFSNVSAEVGILKEGYGLGVALGDVNQDGWTDIYVSNDYLSNDLLYINNQDGTFIDQAEQFFRHTSYSSMGCDLADYNNDSQLDLVAVDMLPPDQTRRKLMMGSINYNRFRSEIKSGYFPQYMRNTLQLNQGLAPDGTLAFSEIGQLAGVHSTDWSWSPLLYDLDNDGWKDLLVTNGYPRDITNLDFASYKANLMMSGQYNEEVMLQLIKEVNQLDGAYLSNYVFQNQGDLTFRNRSEEWGFTQPSYSHGAAVADLDNDGDLDYITNNSYDKVFIYENKAQQLGKSHFIRLHLTGPDVNTGSIGSKIWLYQDSVVQYQELFPFRGYQSTVEPLIHFGLGEKAAVDSLVIQWPNDTRQVIYQPSIDQVLSISYSAQAVKSKKIMTSRGSTVFETQAFSSFQHQEPHFDDFKIQPLLPHKHSQLGPKISSGDVNGDGLDDFFIGGAFRQSGLVFLQKVDGSFESKKLENGAPTTEDLGNLFFDADQDGDLDLYVTSGSSEFPENSAFYQDRLYINDGAGNFQVDTAALPKIYASTSCVQAADFDQDGDQDLFVGGRISPEDYSKAPRSYLLENRQGKFIDVTLEKAPELVNYGKITAVVWEDFDQDGWEDLVVLGEWLPISIFRNERGQFKNITQIVGLSKTVGWWNSLQAYDLDSDGDTDFIAGNLGWNSPYKTSFERPFSLFVGDFDQNDQSDPILVQYLQDRQVPVHFRDDLFNWIFSLRKKFQNYQSYATANWEDIFPNQATQRFDIHTFATSWIENLGNGKFAMHSLPIQAQVAPIYGVLADDFNADGKPDILLSGNTSAPDPHTGQYDAFNGLLLTGDGKGTFLPLPFQKSGFFAAGEGRDLATLKQANGDQLLLVAQNNDVVLFFTFQK